MADDTGEQSPAGGGAPQPTGGAALAVLTQVWPPCEQLLSLEMQRRAAGTGGTDSPYLSLVCAILVAAAKASGASFAPQLPMVAILLNRAYGVLGPEPCCLEALTDAVSAAHGAGTPEPTPASLSTLREVLHTLGEVSIAPMERRVSPDGRCVAIGRADIGEVASHSTLHALLDDLGMSLKAEPEPSFEGLFQADDQRME